METYGVTEAKNRFTELTDRVQREHDRFTVTKNGKPAAIVVSVAEWESLHETLSILRNPDLAAAIDEGRAAAERGEVSTVEEVAADLARKPKRAS